MAAIKQCVIIFTRYPEPGTTKTRLIPYFGSQGAADLQRGFTEHTLSLARMVRVQTGSDLLVYCTGAPLDKFKSWLGKDILYRNQANGDLGARLECAFDQAFKEAYDRILLVGIDCPFLRPHHFNHAFQALSCHDVVLGPAEDGGYTLIGLSSPIPSIFHNMTWSTASVFKTTMDRLNTMRKRVSLLPHLPDIDRPEDVERWRTIQSESTTTLTLSVIIPTLNCADTIASTVESVSGSPGTEAIVVDGGSQDDTDLIASQHGATVVRSMHGRASQMNAGTELSTTDRFLFLHGDTKAPEGFSKTIHEILDDDRIALGAFELGIDTSDWGLRLIEWLANQRSRFFSLPYGDQGIFLRRARFVEMGGFPKLAFLEDLAFVRHARRFGKIHIAPSRVLTSPERWQRDGIIRSTLINQIILAGYFMGFSPENLKRFYSPT